MCSTNKIHVVIPVVILLLFFPHFEHGSSHNLRTKRFFVYPPPGSFTPTKVQLIFGLGLPMEVDVSTIIGYVMKCNYVLPFNASYLMNPYIRYSRSIKYGEKILKNSSSFNEKGRNQPSMTRYEIYRFIQSAFQSGKVCLLRAICESAGTNFNKYSGVLSQLLHIFFTMKLLLIKLIMATLMSSRADVLKSSFANAVHRNIRALSFPDESEMGLFFALAIPLDDPVSTKAISVAFFFEANYQLRSNNTEFQSKVTKKNQKKRSAGQRYFINRKTIYAVLESKFKSLGFPGKHCLLRCICETSQQNIYENNGLIGDLLHITLTPSSTSDEGLPIEYVRAEQVGFEGDCETIYSRCPFTIYDYITDTFTTGE
ncbi:uncharacterized protein LOC122498817 isoform X2 [Leptopilina heterotoma]|uniref:uncharacterized protein LOC122498817 isoform X2 n=1 Tax=Leptopilina heterotoma TaxID=63436 RepID=UPI001CA8626C|nr:uncharacterized protein LOC122498817 isoform X2 [Leptopilina heterotoma]